MSAVARPSQDGESGDPCATATVGMTDLTGKGPFFGYFLWAPAKKVTRRRRKLLIWFARAGLGEKAVDQQDPKLPPSAGHFCLRVSWARRKIAKRPGEDIATHVAPTKSAKRATDKTEPRLRAISHTSAATKAPHLRFFGAANSAGQPAQVPAARASTGWCPRRARPCARPSRRRRFHPSQARARTPRQGRGPDSRSAPTNHPVPPPGCGTWSGLRGRTTSSSRGPRCLPSPSPASRRS